MTVDVLDRISTIGVGAYPGNRSPLVPSPLLKIPLGSVKATGWLGHQLELMRDGMVGHLNELSEFLKADNGWLGGENPGWEEQPYWLRGFYPLGVLTGDARIQAESKRWIEAVIESSQKDGYFGATYHKAIEGNHGETLPDLWPHMVMIDSLILHHEATGDDRVLDLLTDFFTFCADLPDDQFIPCLAGAEWESWRESFGDWKVSIQVKRAGDMIPHLQWLYCHTGDTRLLDLGTRFYRSILPPVDEWLDDHIVHFTQRFGYPATYGRQVDVVLGIQQSEYWYRQHMATWGQQPRGIFAADERVRSGKVDPRQGFETCGMVEFAKQFYQMGRMTGLPLYADRIEDIMLNHFPASQAPDLKALHYLTASNMPQLDAGEDHDFYNKGRQICYSPHIYRCCQHNVAMGWPWYVQNLWQATSDRGVAAWLYGSSEASASVGATGTPIVLEQQTDYPFRGEVALMVSVLPQKTEFPLYLRVPRWCEGFTVLVNGKRVDTNAGPGTVMRLAKEWHQGDEVKIAMPMSVSTTKWPRNGSVTVDRGPLSYSVRVEEKWRRCGGTETWPEWEVLPSSEWNYGLVTTQPPQVSEIRPVASQPWTVEEAPVELEAMARSIDRWTIDDSGTVDPVPQSPVESDLPLQKIKMIPMGCARLRMACLPVVD